MQGQIQKPTTQEERDFIAEGVVRFYEENPEEQRTNFGDEIRESVHELIEGDNNHEYFLIKTGNELAGFLQTMRNENTLEIILIYLLPEYRRQGLGKFAIKKALDELKDESIERIKTEVNIHNDASRSFFEDLDFEKQSLMYLKEG